MEALLLCSLAGAHRFHVPTLGVRRAPFPPHHHQQHTHTYTSANTGSFRENVRLKKKELHSQARIDHQRYLYASGLSVTTTTFELPRMSPGRNKKNCAAATIVFPQKRFLVYAAVKAPKRQQECLLDVRIRIPGVQQSQERLPMGMLT